MTSKLTRKLNHDIILILVVITIGVVFHFYSVNSVFEKSYSLADGFNLQSRLVVINLIYKLFCLILIGKYIFNFLLYMKAGNKKRLTIYLILLLFAFLSILYLPYPKPMYLYEFNGFIAGVKNNIDEQEFRNWFDNIMADISDDESITFETNELSYLSKTGTMECDGSARKYNSGYHELILSWGNALSGHYGLLITNDPETINYIKSNRDVVEVYKDIWAWTEN